MQKENMPKDASTKWLKLRQLDKSLKQFRALERAPTEQGWIREIRRALGMTTQQLAKRVGISQPSMGELEANEVKGAITIKSLSRAAEAMNCRLVYAIIPRTSLEETLKTQISKRAKARLAHVAHTMRLEDQESSAESSQHEFEDMFHRMLISPPRNVWDE